MLSRQERQMLASIEIHLTADAPRLAARFRDLEGRPARRSSPRSRLMAFSSVAVLLMISGVIGAATSAMLGGVFLAALGIMGACALLYRSCTRGRDRGR